MSGFDGAFYLVGGSVLFHDYNYDYDYYDNYYDNDEYYSYFYDYSVADESIYKFTCSNRDCMWTKVKQELSVSRLWFAAMLVPDNFCPAL